MENLIQKYFSPGVILPLETEAYVDLHISATFTVPKVDFPFSAVFLNSSVASGGVISGSATGIVSGNSSTILSSVTAGTAPFLAGIECSGTGNGLYQVYINNILKFQFLTNIMQPNITYTLPILISLSQGDNIRISVSNTSDSTADYFAACVGSF